MKRPQENKAFTLVELIVVITILAILWTIGFLSLQGYSSSARDSERSSDLATISKWLDAQLAAGRLLPFPDTGYLTITASGTAIWYQGYAGANALGAISFWGKGRDPLDGTYYTYSVNALQNRYQVLASFENSSAVALSPFPIAYAWSYSTRTPGSRGSSLGVLLGTGANLNQPVQELYNAGSFTGVDIANTGNQYALYFTKWSIGSGTGNALITAYTLNSVDGKTASKYDPSLVGYWDMETMTWSYLRNLNGSGNDGAIYGSLPSGWVSWAGRSFSNMSEYVGVSNPSILQDSSFSIHHWIKTSGNYCQMYTVANTDGGNGYRFWLCNGKIQFLIWNSSQYTETTCGTKTVNDGEWHSIGIAFDRGASPSATCYIDGVLQQKITLPTNYPGMSISATRIWSGVSNVAFIWTLDEVRIYSRILSDAEMSFFFNGRK